MTLIRYQKPATRESSPYNNILDDFIKDLFIEDKKYSSNFFSVPPANVIESKIDFRIEIAAPGYEKSDFSINIDKNLLTIELNKSVDEAEDESYKYKEYNFNNFRRSFRISNKINTEKISAMYKNGILSVLLPKKEEAIEKPKREIKIS